MLDQNTDRMWYVIGAIVIGAAIIAMGLNIFNESFDSVDGMMASLTDVASHNIANIDDHGDLTLDDYRDKQDELVDSKNLLRDSYFTEPIVNSKYLAVRVPLVEEPVVGDLYTLVVKAENAYVLRPHNSGPAPGLDVLEYLGDGYYVGTFRWVKPSPTYSDTSKELWLYNGNTYADPTTNLVTINWMTMVEGRIPLLDWRN